MKMKNKIYYKYSGLASEKNSLKHQVESSDVLVGYQWN